jgi:putative endonuclease
VLERAIFAIVRFAARKGLSLPDSRAVSADNADHAGDADEAEAAANQFMNRPSVINQAVMNQPSAQASPRVAKHRARRTGIRGETYAYWYLRRHGYTLIARNFTFPDIKGEIDMVAYDGPVLAFVEVKTRSAGEGAALRPEDAVTADKQRYVARIARQFLRTRHVAPDTCRFDVLAIETAPGSPPTARLYKGAFSPALW